MENNQINKKLKVAILGSGNIGTDLLMKVNRSPYICCTNFVGRSASSKGICTAKNLGINISSNGINALIENESMYDLVFDATNAEDHLKHAIIFNELNKKVIDLTPSNIGKNCVPSVNMLDAIKYQNINMVTCGGQASIPLIYVFHKLGIEIEYVEIVTSISSYSAGSATRNNINEYMCATESAIKEICVCKNSKVIINLNPAIPEVDMRTTIYASIDVQNKDMVGELILQMVKKINIYVPGFELLVPPIFDNGIFTCMVKVKGSGDYLPTYSGNLDIITCAAIYAAEEIAKNIMDKQGD